MLTRINLCIVVITALIVEGVKWSLGLVPADVTPKPLRKGTLAN